MWEFFWTPEAGVCRACRAVSTNFERFSFKDHALTKRSLMQLSLHGTGHLCGKLQYDLHIELLISLWGRPLAGALATAGMESGA